MSIAVTAKNIPQPESFAFTPQNMEIAKAYIAKYPAGRQQSAVMPLFWLAQKQHDNWLPIAAIQYVADMLGMPYMRAYEVASFYTQYNLAPRGTFHLQACTTTPCWLRGSDEVLRAIKDEAGITTGQTSADGMFTLTEVECLGACCNAPMMEVNGHDASDEYYEDLDYANTRALLQKLRRGEKPAVGSQIGRKASEPVGEWSTLLEFPGAPAAAATAAPVAKKAPVKKLEAEKKPAAKKPAAKKKKGDE